MKNRMKHLIFVLVLLIGFGANATDGLAVKINENQTLMIEVKENFINGRLTLKDQAGEILFKDCLMEKKSSYTELLDLRELPYGTYHLSFENEREIYTKVIAKTATGLVIPKEGEKIFFKPTFKVDGKMVKFHLTNPSENHTNVMVFDSDGEPVGAFNAKDAVIGKTFDFSRMPSGSRYSIAVKVGDHSFTHKLEI